MMESLFKWKNSNIYILQKMTRTQYVDTLILSICKKQNQIYILEYLLYSSLILAVFATLSEDLLGDCYD